MLEKSYRKPCGPFRLTGVKNPHTGVRMILPSAHQRQKSQFLRKKGICKGPSAEQALPSLAEEGTRERAPKASNPTHPLWMAGGSMACDSLQSGGRPVR